MCVVYRLAGPSDSHSLSFGNVLPSVIYNRKSDFLLCLEFNLYQSERCKTFISDQSPHRVEGAEEILPVITEGILSRRENLIEVGRTGRESPRLRLVIRHPISLIFDLQSD